MSEVAEQRRHRFAVKRVFKARSRARSVSRRSARALRATDGLDCALPNRPRIRSWARWRARRLVIQRG
jgi:hypothetical protein